MNSPPTNTPNRVPPLFSEWVPRRMIGEWIQVHFWLLEEHGGSVAFGAKKAARLPGAGIVERLTCDGRSPEPRWPGRR